MNRDSVIQYTNWLKDYFLEQGMSSFYATLLNTIIGGIIGIIILYLVDLLVRTVIVQLFKAFSTKSTNTFDDYLVQSNFPKYVAHIVPWVFLWYFLPILFHDYPETLVFAKKLATGYLLILGVYILRSILRSIRRYLRSMDDKYADKPLESYQQVIMIFAWGTVIFFLVNVITGYSITSIATLGAASAIILLIFKDTILGFVASIQVSVNDIVRIGDWITFSKYGADGFVIEINLATVRVQNFDNTYTTIPTYSLIADSFQNWRGMLESDGRRIKRALYIKQSSVHFLTTEDIENLKKVSLIKPYLEHRQKDIDIHNEKVQADKSLLINGRNQTNLGVFRKYTDAFLHENPAINQEMLMMVRYLAPNEHGIPLEVFCFSKDKRWQNYEHIQANIFDHLIAAAPYFGLELFEMPSGKDIEKIKA